MSYHFRTKGNHQIAMHQTPTNVLKPTTLVKTKLTFAVVGIFDGENACNQVKAYFPRWLIEPI